MSRTAADIELITNQILPIQWLHINRELTTTTEEVMENSFILMAIIASWVEWDENGRRGKIDVTKWVNTPTNEIIDFLDFEADDEESPLEQ